MKTSRVANTITLTANIAAMQRIADGAGVRLRPHAKTHKCVEIARRQVAAGAVGLTVAKPAEAAVFIRAGIRSVKLCYPMIEAGTIRQVLSLAREHGAELIFVIDSALGLQVLDGIATGFGAVVPVYLEVDVGLHRCGVAPDGPALVNLAGQAAASPNLDFLGLTAHAGHAYAATDRDAAARIAEEERLTMLAAKQRLAEYGIAAWEICVGSTPSIWAQRDFTGITEIKPGNYVFNDLTQLSIGVVGWDQLALTIAATVVSANDTYLIIDTGSKTLTSDLGPHGNNSITGHGRAFTLDEIPGEHPGRTITKLSEEHGWIAHNGKPLPLGTHLVIYPNHSCPVVNLTDRISVTENGEEIAQWPIDARGCS